LTADRLVFAVFLAELAMYTPLKNEIHEVVTVASKPVDFQAALDASSSPNRRF